MFMAVIEYLVPLSREKMISMYFRSLLMSFESFTNLTNQIPSLLNLIVSIVFNYSIGVKNMFIGLVNEI